MSEEEGYVGDAKRDLMPKEYIAKISYQLHYFDRMEPPDENEIRNSIKNYCLNNVLSFCPNYFMIESVDTA